jgi:hypothetical protein
MHREKIDYPPMSKLLIRVLERTNGPRLAAGTGGLYQR